ncbi:glutathione S-transferase N-terminal domain-containing protein [Antarcticirhabdus aurantiaca]|uniref:Glutathione S-transferase N-terminal domain-containing protein n=1 Tax=Antarcticirhabdus aurantiaca TaxID=2606717 RepID=A0ACD4NJS3_9HYPH|nr:glutathione S-transferase N-terminal domain-containing protein [Antarcticirhabdus aurantiaca]WAJ27085.1 glutathione S-transferase N-terminal domain-containing protein [Jeongeuplla avenae]
MIELYTWTTPNGEKPVIMLEECGLEYGLHMTDISTGLQKKPDFLAMNPNGRIPALVDRTENGGEMRVFESGSILVYLAEKTGQFLPTAQPHRAETFSWTFFQVGGTGPMIGQLHHFKSYAPEKIPYAIERYENETRRLLGVLESRLSDFEWLAGPYGIADMINWSWARSGLDGVDGRSDFPALAAWVDRIAAREPVKRALGRMKAAKEAASG